MKVVVEEVHVRAPVEQLVCHRDRIATLLYAGTAPGGAAPADIRLAHALDGHEVLVYGSGEAEQRAFARSLRNRLAAV